MWGERIESIEMKYNLSVLLACMLYNSVSAWFSLVMFIQRITRWVSGSAKAGLLAVVFKTLLTAILSSTLHTKRTKLIRHIRRSWSKQQREEHYFKAVRKWIPISLTPHTALRQGCYIPHSQAFWLPLLLESQASTLWHISPLQFFHSSNVHFIPLSVLSMVL